MKPVRIFQFSDCHIVEENSLAYDVVDTSAYLDRAVSYANSLMEDVGPVDAVVVTGDLTDHGRVAQYERLRGMLDRLVVPYYLLPGNHDRRDNMRQVFPDHGYLEGGSDEINYSLSIDDLTLLCIDSSVPGASHGELTETTTDWLASQISDLGNRPVMVAFHHPPFDSGVGHMDRQRLRDPSRLFEILGGHQGPHQMICGHVHRFITSQTPAGPAVIAPGTSHAVALDHREDGASAFRMEPGAFLMHSFDDRSGFAGFTSEYVPVGPFDGPYLFYPDRQ